MEVIGGGKKPQPKAVVKRPNAKKSKIPEDNLLLSLEVDISPEAVEQLFSKDESVIQKRLAEITLQEDEPLHPKNDPKDDWFGEEPCTMPSITEPGVLVPEICLPAVQSKDIVAEKPEQMPIVSSEEANKENEPIALPSMQTGRQLDPPAQPRASKRVKNIAKALCVKRTNPQVVAINRRKEQVYDDVNYTELSKNENLPLPQFSYFKNFWQEPMETSGFVERLKVSEFSSSGSLGVRNIRSASQSRSELTFSHSRQPVTPTEVIRTSLRAEAVSSSLTPKGRTVDMIESLIEDVPLPAGYERRHSVKKMQSSRNQAARLSKQQKEVDVVELHKQVQVRSQETSAFGGQWADKIMALMEDHPRLTPVEICQHLNAKLSKLNMATIFASLLELSKNGSVTLHSFPDSNELEYAEKKT